MSNDVFLPDRHLIGVIIDYEVTHSAVDRTPFWPSRKLTFNLSGTPIVLDGRGYDSPCLFCISHDPGMVMLEKGEGDVLVITLRNGGFHRLFGLDGVEFGGAVIEAGHNRFPAMANIGRALAAAPLTLEARKDMLDRMFIELLDNAKPEGLLGKFRFIAYHTKGRISVAEAASRLGVSARTLERDCRLRSGQSPKRILCGFRFANLDWSNQAGGPTRFDRFGDNMPYSDQAHFLREYRTIIGLNPTAMYEANEWRRRTGYNIHSRDDLSVFNALAPANYMFENPSIEAEYEQNASYFPYGPESVRDLGLEDWNAG